MNKTLCRVYKIGIHLEGLSSWDITEWSEYWLTVSKPFFFLVILETNHIANYPARAARAGVGGRVIGAGIRRKKNRTLAINSPFQ